MKVLIWGLTLFVASLLNVLLGYAFGFRAGYILVYLVVWFVAKKLCKMWDVRKQSREINSDNQLNGETLQSDPSAPAMSASTEPTQNSAEAMAQIAESPEIKYCRKCGYELIGKSDFCSNCGSKIFLAEEDKIGNERNKDV